jgi:hypothetical protein
MKEIVNKIDKQLSLQFMNQLTTTLFQTGRIKNRVFILLLLLSLIVLGICSGTIEASDTIVFSGINFKVPTWVMLIISNWIVGVIMVYHLALFAHAEILEAEIYSIYKSLGYDIKREWILKSSPFRYPDFHNMMMNMLHSGVQEIASIVISFLYMVTVFFGPIVAQFLSSYRLVSIFGWTWWIILNCTLVLIVSILYAIGWVRERTKNNE